MSTSQQSSAEGATSSNTNSDNQQSRDSSSHRGRSSNDFRSNNSRGRGRGDSRGKKKNMGRNEWSKSKVDRRTEITRRQEERAAKRQKLEDDQEDVEKALPIYATKFDKDEIAAEDRRPKRKVAVMIGYSGTGYRGMQLAHDQKTIEGDLFQAFVKAGAISKANADDPKKSSFVRCARTDKGVHAAGNVISLKLIVEEEDIVQKINDALVPQIRVWGFERTINSFSAYQLCDSRIYEYLIPSYSFIPPHPRSHLGRKCKEWAGKKEDVEGWQSRQHELLGYWDKVDEQEVKPVLEDYDESIQQVLEKAIWLHAEQHAQKQSGEQDVPDKSDRLLEERIEDEEDKPDPTQVLTEEQKEEIKEKRKVRRARIEEAVRRLKQVYIDAKRRYRIDDRRKQRVQEVLNQYLGTRNYHNYTVQKPFKDPSAKRVIKTFDMNPEPILIDGTEWLSLKVHGQSFMMHQIRKMIGMAALIVRCGANPRLIHESYGPKNLSIPKAPALGLLLERPVFDSYNKRAESELSKEPIGFNKYQAEMDAFKHKFIYERMYQDEEEQNVFGNFFNHVDNFPSEAFLFVTSGGFEACGALEEGGNQERRQHNPNVDADSDDEEEIKMQKRDGAGDEG